MGSTMSARRVDDADTTSDEEPDFSYIRKKSRPVSERMNCELDAVTAGATTPAVSRESPDLTAVADQLEPYEKVSLIYLLNGDPHDALVRMKEVENGGSFSILPGGFSLGNDRNKEMLIEALCSIQNYEVLKKVFGKRKPDLIERYSPLHSISINLDRTRKCLYRLFEDMTYEDAEHFLKVIKKELKEQFRTFHYLEMYFAYFETIEFVTRDNFGNIEKALIAINKDAHYATLRSLSNRRNERINLDRAQGSSLPDESYNLNPAFGGRSSSLSAYSINPDSPGIVAIIENESFYTECDDEYKDQLCSVTGKIPDRAGSQYDSERLKTTFERFNFKVIPMKNMTHLEMLKFVWKVAHETFQKEHSCLFICLLSHGKEGKVIASNSIPVAINDIKNQLNSPNLQGKPKVLIIQSCQGDEIQTLTTDSASSEVVESVLTTDSPSRHTPPTVDFLEIWSTVPGYASIRDRNKGTWFIQSLCNVIDESHEGSDMHEICLKTRERILEMEWKVKRENKTEIRVMVCETRETLRKLLKLPSVARRFKV